MNDNGIDLEIKAGIAILTLARENCLNIEGKHSIASQIRHLNDNLDEARALIICATHPAAWLVDVAELADMPQEQAQAFTRGGHQVAAAIADLSIPVIAAVDGPALGGGCELVLACDVAFAGEKATFGQIEAQGGVIPAFGGTWRLEERVGYQRALAMMFTASVIDATTAKAYGLVLEVHPSAALLEKAKEFAGHISAASKASIAAIKRVTRAGRGAPAAIRNQLEEEAFPLFFGTSEQRNRMHAFLKQQPDNSGKQSTPGIVHFIQVWAAASKDHQEKLLAIMHQRIVILTKQPGFLSIHHYASLDGKQIAVFAQWADEKAFATAIGLPEAKEAHDEMTKWGTSAGATYRLDSIHLPG